MSLATQHFPGSRPRPCIRGVVTVARAANAGFTAGCNLFSVAPVSSQPASLFLSARFAAGADGAAVAVAGRAADLSFHE